uniref:Uncharacterized protein n=1 Tax=Anguilla anguilla TaxID=7936 RepID=A0A0E9SFL3_ANGAN
MDINFWVGRGGQRESCSQGAVGLRAEPSSFARLGDSRPKPPSPLRWCSSDTLGP